MRFWSKIICLLLVCLTLSSCNLDDYLFYSIKPNPKNIDVDDINVFFDKTYTEYDGGKDAEAFFDKYVRTNEYKDIAFHYSYRDHIAASSIGTILKASSFSVDVYYRDEDFFEIAYDIIPHTNMANRSFSEYLSPSNGYFLVTRAIDESLNQDNLYSVMFDVQHRTIRYVFIYRFYSKDFLADDVPFVPGLDDRKIHDLTEVVLPQLKWNGSGPRASEEPDDWIFDYSDIIDIEYSKESEVE